MHLELALGCESEAVLFCVELPPQYCIIGRPGGVPLPDLLCEYGLLTKTVCGCVWPKDCVDAPKEVAEHLLLFREAALACGDEIVQVDVYLGQGVHPQIGGGLHPLFIVVCLGCPLFRGLCVC